MLVTIIRSEIEGAFEKVYTMCVYMFHAAFFGLQFSFPYFPLSSFFLTYSVPYINVIVHVFRVETVVEH